MIKLLKSLSIPLLLAFVSFTLIHFSHTLLNSHTDIKAIINVDDGKVKDKWDDEKKLPVVFQTLVVLTIILSTAVTPLIYLSISFDRSFIFLIPIFHQSNYVIHPPE
jgi:hypothetical protein